MHSRKLAQQLPPGRNNMAITYLKNTSSGTYHYKSKEATKMALRSIIFDCDGVLLDSEPLHFAALKKTLGTDGETLTEELYKERLLALDDKGSIQKFYQDRGRELTPEELSELAQKKTQIFQELVQSEGLLPFPAVPELIMAMSQRYPLAIASGSRRHELETLLEAAGIRRYFEVIISTDDVEKGKPHPESYLKALEGLNTNGKRNSPIKPEEVVVIEDSREGIASAHAAGMKCIAVSTSYPAFELSIADLVVPSMASLKMSQVEDLFYTPTPLPIPSSQNN